MFSAFANLHQHDPRRSGEVGVQAEHFDGERHLVDDTLTGAVATAEKLQILDDVMLPVAVVI
jgi:hypothetical protein